MSFSLPPSPSLALPWEQMDVTRTFGTSFIRQKGSVQYDRANTKQQKPGPVFSPGILAAVGLVQLSIHYLNSLFRCFSFFFHGAHTTKASLSGALTLGSITSPRHRSSTPTPVNYYHVISSVSTHGQTHNRHIPNGDNRSFGSSETVKALSDSNRLADIPLVWLGDNAPVSSVVSSVGPRGHGGQGPSRQVFFCYGRGLDKVRLLPPVIKSRSEGWTTRVSNLPLFEGTEMFERPFSPVKTTWLPIPQITGCVVVGSFLGSPAFREERRPASFSFFFSFLLFISESIPSVTLWKGNQPGPGV